MCTLICTFKAPDWVKLLPQTVQVYGLTPKCTLSCTSRLLADLNFLSQCAHWYGRTCTSEWTLRCLSRYPFAENRVEHVEHSYGLSLLWVIIWAVKPDDWENFLLQMLQAYGFSCVWVHLCGLTFCWTSVCVPSVWDVPLACDGWTGTKSPPSPLVEVFVFLPTNHKQLCKWQQCS